MVDPRYPEPGSNDDNNRQWTVLIYMAGDNNLSEECVYSLIEAKEALTDYHNKLAVLAQFDPSGVLAETKRYLLRSKEKPLEKDAEKTGWKASETNTGEPHNLLEFLRWGMSQYPAEHTLVVLVGHGSGTDDDFLLRDDNPPDALSIDELRFVFEQLTADRKTVDVLGMDTCLMNMAEVCFELLRTNVTYMVGSEGFSPNTGWPYKNILKQLADQVEKDYDQSDPSKKLADPKWLARLIVEEYRKFYVPYINGGISVDQSVLEVKKIQAVKERMFSLVGTLIKELDNGELDSGKTKQNAMVLAHWDTQSYNGEVFVDLYDFCGRLASRYLELGVTSDAIAQCHAVQTAIADLVIRNCVAGSAFQFSFGISIYFPWAVCSPQYGNLSFPKETRWLDFLDRYHKKTRRLGRSGIEIGDEDQPPHRASVPTNKGRNGRVESMRNPPIEEFTGDCIDVDPQTESKPAREMRTPEKRTNTVKRRTKRVS